MIGGRRSLRRRGSISEDEYVEFMEDTLLLIKGIRKVLDTHDKSRLFGFYLKAMKEYEKGMLDPGLAMVLHGLHDGLFYQLPTRDGLDDSEEDIKRWLR